jgi:FAD/FMN-containing dehydrogenase
MARLIEQNWKRSITYYPSVIEVIHSVEDLQRIVTDTARYPSPVRAKGSHHSTTECVVADEGTVCDLSQMTNIVSIDKENLKVTMQAGVKLIDAAKEIEKHGLQFYVNIELGNLTLGSGGTGNTKDASYFANGDWEYGQVDSYCCGMKIVTHDGTIREVTEEAEPDLMEALRTSYGMLGIAYELTFHVKPISAMSVHHEFFHIDDFCEQFPKLLERKTSMMFYYFPFLNRVLIEFRHNTDVPVKPGAWVWKVRNYSWKTLWPFIGNTLHFLPIKFLRYGITNFLNWFTAICMQSFLKINDSSPADQVIRYHPTAPFACYTFSIWGFDRDTYPQAIKAYYEFVRTYSKQKGYRTDLLNVGYHIKQDRSALFSYTRHWNACTIDPVATGRGDFMEFLAAYNEFCSSHGARPLLNQTPKLTQAQVTKAFAEEIKTFQTFRTRMDPNDRFYNKYFKTLFSGV